MKKFLKVATLSATACALLGTATVSAATEGTGQTTVTYEPGVVSPSGATWAVSYTASVTLNNSNIAENLTASEVDSNGQDITFTVFDNGLTTSDHNSNDTVKISLPTSSTNNDGSIDMQVTGINNGAPKMALAKDNSTLVKAYDSEGDIATLVNTTTGSNQYTATIKAAITDTGNLGSNAKASAVLTFKFTGN